MSIALEDLVEKRQQTSKAYDEVTDWQRYMKDNPNNATLVQKVALLERQCEDATASAASSSFSKFSQEEIKEISIRTNKEHHDLVCELF